MSNAAGTSWTYVLGHSDRELERLRVQARLIDPITLRFMREGGRHRESPPKASATSSISGSCFLGPDPVMTFARW
jgi:hypothetical protein